MDVLSNPGYDQLHRCLTGAGFSGYLARVVCNAVYDMRRGQLESMCTSDDGHALDVSWSRIEDELTVIIKRVRATTL